MLRLAEDTEPLTWILHEHRELVTCRLLWRELSPLREAVLRIRQSMTPEAAATGPNDPMIAGFMDALSDPLLVETLESDDARSTEGLRRTVRQLRRAFHPLIAAARARGAAHSPGILNEIMLLPDGEDPLAWIDQHHALDAAKALLREVQEPYSFPPPVSPLGRVLHAQGPIVAIDIDNRLQVEVELLVIGTAGFRVEGRVRISRAGLPIYPDGGNVLLSWTGFGQVTDDQGHHYLHRSELMTWPSDLGEQPFRLECFPAVAEGATELIFHSSPALLVAQLLSPPSFNVGPSARQASSHSSKRQEYTTLLSRLNLGNLEWRVKIPEQR